jgi:alkylhydroperoxidase family enzyme
MRDALAALRPPVQRHPDPIRGDHRPAAPGVFETFAHHAELARAFFTFNGHILLGTTLTARQRQMVILRVATRRKCAFLWGQHVFSGRDAGLTDEEMARVAFGPEAPFFDPLETALLSAVDELIDEGAITDDTWSTLASEFDVQQLLDMVFTVGCYDTMSFFLRSLDIEVDPRIPELLSR